MRILLVGNGAREHAIAQKLHDSGNELYAFMNKNNPGIAKLAKRTILGNYNDQSLTSDDCQAVDFAFIGPEQPLVNGLVDYLENKLQIPTIGPRKEAARLEASKIFAREFLTEANIDANPLYAICKTKEDIQAFLTHHSAVAVKPDGLTGGKGVKLTGDHLKTREEVVSYAQECIKANNRVLIEEKLHGQEFTLQTFVDGHHVVPMPLVKDYKRAFDGDQGPNTGSMGSYSCANHLLPFLSKSIMQEALQIMQQTIDALRSKKGINYKGILYGQFMLVDQKPILIEYNVRFGDPEAINVLEILNDDLTQMSEQIIDGSLTQVDFSNKATTVVYMVPNGYPIAPKTDIPIKIVPEKMTINHFWASVYEKENEIKSTSSRALALVATGKNVADARTRVYQQLKSGAIDGSLYYRTDIAKNVIDE